MRKISILTGNNALFLDFEMERGADEYLLARLAKKDPRDWEKILEAAGAPCASIWKIEEVIDHPQIAARGAIQEIDTPYGRLRFAGSGFQLAHGGGRLDTMAPELSAHTDEVLASLGYDADAIADLRARDVV